MRRLNQMSFLVKNPKYETAISSFRVNDDSLENQFILSGKNHNIEGFK